MSDHHGEKNPHFKHGGKGTKLYEVWYTMRARCNRKSSNGYARYGARGITVCEEWSDFVRFRDWSIENGYREGLMIDRIDNNGNYEPLNCRWATAMEQNNNTSVTRMITFQGETKPMRYWADKFSISKDRLKKRLNAGWSTEDAILQPANYRYSCKKRSNSARALAEKGEATT